MCDFHYGGSIQRRITSVSLPVWIIWSSECFGNIVVCDFFVLGGFSTFGKYIDEKCEEAKRSPAKSERELSILEQLMLIDKDLAFAMTFDMLSAGTDTVRTLVLNV